MADYLSVTDLFIVGLALDATGAVLLAKGLLISPATIAGITAITWNGNPRSVRDRCESRVDAQFGVLYLVGGFALQAIGYGLEIGGVSGETGIRRLIAATALALIAAGIATLAYSRLREGRTETLFSGAEGENERRARIQEERQERDRKRRKAEAEKLAAEKRAAKAAQEQPEQ